MKCQLDWPVSKIFAWAQRSSKVRRETCFIELFTAQTRFVITILSTHTHTPRTHTHVANKILVGLCGQSPPLFPSHRTNKTLEQLSAPKRLPHLIDTNFASCFALLPLPLPHTPHIFSDCSLIVCKHWHVLWQQKEYNRNEKNNANKYEKKGTNPKKLLAKLDCHKNWQAEEIWRIVTLKKLKEVNQWKATDVVFFLYQ